MIALITPVLLSLGPLALLLVVAILFAETGLLVGFVLPGDGLLFTVGVLVAAGALPLPIWLVLLGCALAAVVGDQVGYQLGRSYGPRLFSRPGSRFLDPHHAVTAQAFFDRHGPKAVVIARFVPWARTFTPAVAGVGRMPRRRFTTYNVLGGLLWTVGLLGIGYLFGGIPLVAAHVALVPVALVSCSLLPASALAYRKHRSRRRGGGPGLVEDGRRVVARIVRRVVRRPALAP